MKSKHIISFISGLSITTLIFGLTFLLALLMTFDLAGGETLRQIEIQRTGLLIITILLSIFAGLAAKQYLKKGKRYTAYGIGAITLMILVSFSIYYIDNLNLHTQFDKKVWQKSELKPFKMSATLVKDKKLVGFSRQKVKDMLGQGSEENGDESTDRGSIIYIVENEWIFSVYFQKDKVVEVELRLPFLGV